MNNKVIIEGRWWIFGKENSSHFGILEYNPVDSTVLSVKIPHSVSVESTIELIKDQKGAVPSTIFGADKHNRHVSLFGCIVTKSTISTGQQDFAISVMVVVCGVHAATWDDVYLDRIGVEYSLLHNWVGKSRISVTHGQEAAVQLSASNSTDYELHGGVKLKFCPTLGFDRTFSNFSIKENHRVEFHFPEPRSVKETVHTYVESFRRFLTLAVGKVVFIDKLYAQIEPDGNPLDNTILMRNPGVTDADRTLHHMHMRANYPEMQAEFGQVIQSWYQLESTINDVLNLYFATTFNRSLYANQRFLFLAQALEVYHRTSPRYNNMVQPKADFRARKKRIADAVPDERDWLNEKLGHANEKTLAQRLDELLKIHAGEVSQFIQDTKSFADCVRHTRNHFTHYGTEEQNMDKVANGVSLIRTSDHMEALLEICILKDLGITGAPIDRIIGALKTRYYFGF